MITQSPAPAMPTRAVAPRRPRLSKYSEHLPLYRQSEIYAQASGSVKSGSPEAFRYMTNRPQALSCSLADGRLKINNIAGILARHRTRTKELSLRWRRQRW
jgi:transposase